MIPIVKRSEPTALVEAKREIRNTPDVTFGYAALHGASKRRVLEALVVEQGYLCAYCMCRIGTDGHPATIEHLTPQHPVGGGSDSDGELSLSYRNLVAVCDGRNGVTCDKRRGNAQMTVNPTRPHTLATIAYHRDGSIYAGNPAIQHDLQETLGLNDPRTSLCASRAAAMGAIEKAVFSKVTRKHIENNRDAKRRICLKILEMYSNQSKMKDEYLGAKLFKAQKLAAKFSD